MPMKLYDKLTIWNQSVLLILFVGNYNNSIVCSAYLGVGPLL